MARYVEVTRLAVEGVGSLASRLGLENSPSSPTRQGMRKRESGCPRAVVVEKVWENLFSGCVVSRWAEMELKVVTEWPLATYSCPLSRRRPSRETRRSSSSPPLPEPWLGKKYEPPTQAAGYCATYHQPQMGRRGFFPHCLGSPARRERKLPRVPQISLQPQLFSSFANHPIVPHKSQLPHRRNGFRRCQEGCHAAGPHRGKPRQRPHTH